MQQRTKMPLSISSTIRSVLAGFFLVLFAFTITPKKILHYLVANHNDGRAIALVHDVDATNLAKSTFNCQTDSPISESPFVPDNGFTCTLSETPFSIYLHNFVQSQCSSDLFCFGLRGPPAC